jgi:hypothetical protein
MRAGLGLEQAAVEERRRFEDLAQAVLALADGRVGALALLELDAGPVGQQP